jgi:hypothetical protein
LESAAIFLNPGGPSCEICDRFGYNPFTAAVEKIALSMVHVNLKPQHLVFWSHTPHLPAKHRHLPVESSEHTGPARIFCPRIASKPVHSMVSRPAFSHFPA